MNSHKIAFCLAFVVAVLAIGAAQAEEYKGKPWKGERQVIPGKIVAAWFDEGGEGVAFHDVDKTNQGSGTLNRGKAEKDTFRKEEAVDLSYTKSAFDKFADGKLLEIDEHYVGWTAAGEWLNYSVDVKTAGVYTVNMLASSNNKNAEISLSVNGVDKTGAIVVETTTHWHTWRQNDKFAELTLEKGPQLITLKFNKEGNMNVRYLEFVPKETGK